VLEVQRRVLELRQVTRVVCISDTHGKHKKLAVPDGDLLIHAGDFTMLGTLAEIVTFLNWFRDQPHAHKVLIAGNHDRLFERESLLCERLAAESGAIYLNDNEALVADLRIYGSPITPEFAGAFNRNQAEIDWHWQNIPEGIDVLVTHGPPHGVLDAVKRGRVGCRDLARHIGTRLRPNLKLHVFGHIHESYGQATVHDVTFVNACSLDELYQPVNPPIVVEL
jgi:Icc-related predicted phosphoesterase